MEAVTIIETARLVQMEQNVEKLVEFINKAVKDLQSANRPYMTEQEVMEFTGTSRTTIYRNRDQIGFSRPAGTNLTTKTINAMNTIAQEKFELAMVLARLKSIQRRLGYA